MDDQEEIRPVITIEKTAGNTTYFQVFRWTENWNNEWTVLKTTTDRSEAERYIGEQTKIAIRQECEFPQIKIDRDKYILVSFDLPTKP